MIFFEYAIFLIVKVRAAQAFILRHILGCASSPTFLRLSFAQPSLNLRWEEFWILDWRAVKLIINH